MFTLPSLLYYQAESTVLTIEMLSSLCDMCSPKGWRCPLLFRLVFIMTPKDLTASPSAERHMHCVLCCVCCFVSCCVVFVVLCCVVVNHFTVRASDSLNIVLTVSANKSQAKALRVYCGVSLTCIIAVLWRKWWPGS